VDILSKEEKDETGKFENAAEGKEKYLLRLYVTGMTPRSVLAIENIRRICEERLKGRYELEVVDIYQQPERAKEAELVAAPTLIKRLPLPLRKLVGDMSNTERVLIGLNLQPKNR
jgi:circadian clock protein KaiB